VSGIGPVSESLSEGNKSPTLISAQASYWAEKYTAKQTIVLMSERRIL